MYNIIYKPILTFLLFCVSVGMTLESVWDIYTSFAVRIVDACYHLFKLSRRLLSAFIQQSITLPKRAVAILKSFSAISFKVPALPKIPTFKARKAQRKETTTETHKKKRATKIKLSKKNVRRAKLSALLLRSKYFILGGAFTVISVLAPLQVFAWFKDLPQPELLLQPNRNSTKLFDRQGRLLYEIYNDKQFEYIALNKIPDELVNATIAIEDDEFYTHPGIRPLSIIRAAKATFLDSEIQGASTITQQLIKNVLLSPEQTYTRKIKEAVLALMVEKRFSKDQIIELYLNNTPYGGTAWGVQSASKKFFGKNVWDLSLAESSMLAGLPLSPTAYSPFNDFEKAKARQSFVLRRMLDLGYISKDNYRRALDEKVTLTSQKEYIRAPHFVNYIRDELVDRYGQRMVEFGGLTVKTTLDLDLQDKAQEIVTTEVDKSGDLNISNGAALVLDVDTGEILAYVGSKKFFSTDYDGAYDVIRAYRQPGSSIKTLAYAMALESGMTPASTLNDSPLSINTGTEVYTPKNYDGAFHGVVTLRSALANSYNIPAVRLSVKLGPDAIIAKGKEAGLTGWELDGSYGYSVVLGGRETRLLDMVNMYAMFARQGTYYPLQVLLQLKMRMALRYTKTLGNQKDYLVRGLHILFPKSYLIMLLGHQPLDPRVSLLLIAENM
jgi:membrane peptidoglycan carboxypeptidase